MEGDLMEKLGRLNFKTQVEAFYTAYSKVRLHLPFITAYSIMSEANHTDTKQNK